MGQRHQIYVVNKTKEGMKCVNASHHQWCYGMRATVNLHRCIELLRKQEIWYQFTDSRAMENIIRRIWGFDYVDDQLSLVHTCEDYLIDEETGLIKPENGDNNDGCTLIIIDHEKKDIKGCMFTIHGCEGEHGVINNDLKPIKSMDYLQYYYDLETIQSKDFQMQYGEHLLLIERVSTGVVTQKEFNACLFKGGK